MSAHVGTTVAAHDCTTVTAHDGVAALGRVLDGRTRAEWSCAKWARAERSRGGCRCSGRSTSRMYTVWIDLARARTFENNISKNLEDSRKCSHQVSDDLVRLGPLLTGGTNGSGGVLSRGLFLSTPVST